MENSEGSSWTRHLLKPDPDWEKRINTAPVVKVTMVSPEGKVIDEMLATFTPVIRRSARGEQITHTSSSEPEVVSLLFEIGEDCVHSEITGVEVESLKAGGWRHPISNIERRVEFVGFVGDEEHKGRKWSYVGQ